MKLESSNFNRIAKLLLFTLAAGVGLGLSAGRLLASANYEPYTFTHFAGSIGGPGYADGTGSAARFASTSAVAVDSSSNVYVADTYNDTIRKMTPEGVVTTLAGSAGYSGSADGTGSEARFNLPSGVAVDGSGNVYVADSGNDTIRKITPGGVVTTLAGLPGVSGSANGTGSAAQFNDPLGVAVDGSGNVYVTDSGNYTIRMITPAGVVATLAGAGISGSANGTGNKARFNVPFGVAVDGSGNVYVADTDNNTIRMITPAGAVTTLAGKAKVFGSADGTGNAAQFYEPYGVAVDGSGNVYVADYFNYEVRTVTPAGVVTTLAGLPATFGSVDGTGNAARFNSPYGVAVDTNGNVYVADTLNQTIRKITPAGAVTTFAGLAATFGSADGTNSAARFFDPFAVAVDSSNNVYVADNGNNTIRKITPAGVVTTLAGLAGASGSADGTNSMARFNGPCGVAVDSSGNVYVADSYNYTIRKITPNGLVTTLAGLVGAFGNADGTNSAARFNAPFGVATDSSSNIYVGDSGNQTIRKITPEGVVTTLAGLAGNPGGDDGTNSAARFDYPRGVAVDASGNVYVSDYYNFTIRKITPAGVVTTLAGLAQAFGSDDGTGSAARFYFPNSLAVDASGNVYVAEINNCAIRKGVAASVAPALPVLGGTETNNQIVFVWPTSYAGFTLQSSPDLGPAANWTNITNNPPAQALQFVVTNPISGGAQFFRLKK